MRKDVRISVNVTQTLVTIYVDTVLYMNLISSGDFDPCIPNSDGYITKLSSRKKKPWMDVHMGHIQYPTVYPKL